MRNVLGGARATAAHALDLARYAASRSRRDRDDADATRELTARTLELPAGLEIRVARHRRLGGQAVDVEHYRRHELGPLAGQRPRGQGIATETRRGRTVALNRCRTRRSSDSSPGPRREARRSVRHRRTVSAITDRLCSDANSRNICSVMSAYESLPGTAAVIERPDFAGAAGEGSKLLTRRRRATLSGQDAHSLRA